MPKIIAPNIQVKQLKSIPECLYPLVGQSITAHMRSMCRDDEGIVFYIRRVDTTNTSKDIEIYQSRFPAPDSNGLPVSFSSLQWDLDRSTWSTRMERVVTHLLGEPLSSDPLISLSPFVRNRKIIILVGEKVSNSDVIRYMTFPPALAKTQTLAEYTLPLWQKYVARQTK